jgi:hypothetical protein
LLVKPIDVYRFQFQASRYKTFGEHIASFSGQVGEIPHGIAGTPAATASTLLASTHAAITEVMSPEAKAETRQKLFEQWIGQLVLPLRKSTSKLELSRLIRSGATDLLLLENPEPLPLSKDVSLILKKRGFTLPLPQAAKKLPLPLQKVSAQIELDGERVKVGPVALNHITQLLGTTQWLVHAIAVGHQLDYHIYEIFTPVIQSNTITITGRISQIFPPSSLHKGSVPWLDLLEGIAPNEVALIDHNDDLLFGAFLPISQSTFVEVPIRVLTDGSESRALILPVASGGNTLAPLPSGIYRLEWEIDRARYRSQTPDEESNYRAQASFTIQW